MGVGGKRPEGLEIPSHHQRKAAGTHPTPTPFTPPSSLSVVPTGMRRQGVWDLGGALGGEGHLQIGRGRIGFFTQGNNAERECVFTCVSGRACVCILVSSGSSDRP